MVIKLFFSVLWIGFCVTFAILFQALLWPLITLGFLLKAIPYRKVKAFLLWLAWDGSGLRAVFEHLRPPTEEEKVGRRPPATFSLWVAGIFSALFGIYTVIFGIASGRYEGEVDRLEMRANSVIALMANDKVRPQACGQIAGVQERKVPFKPELWKPRSILKSFDPEQNTVYQESIDVLVKAVESCKDNLENANLMYAKLRGANLMSAELRGANLMSAELHDAYLMFAELHGADLMFAELHGANLARAKLHGASLWRAELHGADLRTAKLHGAFLRTAKLHGADLMSAELYGADLRSADFTCAYLHEADLEDVRNWEEANFTNCNIIGIRNAPQGFRDWALWNGAVEMEDYEWERYLLGE